MSARDFLENKGRGLIKGKAYGGSPFALLKAVYTDFEFLPWMFDKTQRGFFDKVENRKKYIEWLVQKVGVSKPTDLQTKHFEPNGGKGLLKKYGNSPQKVVESIDAELASTEVSQRAQKPRHFWVCLD